MKAKKSLLLFLLIAFPLLAEEQRVEIGSRPKKNETAQNETNKPDLEEEEIVEDAGFLFGSLPPVYYSGAYHNLRSITVLNDSQFALEIEDGSVWKISGYDAQKALNWLITDPLVITQNNRWFSSHEYRILNKGNATSVEATLFLGPIERGEYSRVITDIDYALGQVILNDYTYWEIAYQDLYLFNEWLPGDYVIVGTNSVNGFFEEPNEALLINVNENRAVRAKQI